jgi:uncharacterized protein (DUF736 family)
MEYDNTNRGVLFRNDRKETEKHPDYKGSINVEGEDRWLSAWLREGKDGNKYLSISTQAKQGESATSGARTRKAETIVSSEDIPF